MKIDKYKGNPILTKFDVPFKVNSIFNPGAVKIGDQYLLLCRIEMLNGRSSLILAKGKDGRKFKVDSKPALTSEDDKEFYEYVNWGVEDPRIQKIDEKFYITYTGYSKNDPLVMLAETTDFSNFKIIGPVSEPSNKDAALFPEKINDFYWKIDRPTLEKHHAIWINKSPDLIHWGSYRFLYESEKGCWEADKVGCSTPPIKTKDGWLLLYHGVRGFGISNIYKIGVMLLDLKEPWKVIGKSKEPILQPDLDYERIGDVQNVVFTNGWIVEDDGSVKIYYSGADTNICLAETSVDYLLSLCR